MPRSVRSLCRLSLAILVLVLAVPPAVGASSCADRRIEARHGTISVVADEIALASDPSGAPVLRSGGEVVSLAGCWAAGKPLQLALQSEMVTLEHLSIPGTISIETNGELIVVGNLDATAIRLASARLIDLRHGASLSGRGVTLNAPYVVASGNVEASGGLAVTAERLVQHGALRGKNVRLEVRQRLLMAERAAIEAEPGGAIAIAGTAKMVLSGSLDAPDGSITLDGWSLDLVGARLAAETIRVGDGAASDSVYLASASHLAACRVELSARRSVDPEGTIDAETVLIDPKNLLLDAATGLFPQFALLRSGGAPGDRFGQTVVPLPNGRVAVSAPGDDIGAPDGGAAYLYNGLTGALVSVVTGSHISDTVGLFFTVLQTGNFVVQNPEWNGARGAVTFVDAATGLGGIVSSANSLIGQAPGEGVGSGFLTTIGADRYGVSTFKWSASRGAVTIGSSLTGITGTVSAANSVVGTAPSDDVGMFGFSPHPALGPNVIAISSPYWNLQRGAITVLDAVPGMTGTVSVANSIIGAGPGDQVGFSFAQSVGPDERSLLVVTPRWNGNRGAATFVVTPTLPVSLVVTTTNSLVGSLPGDGILTSATTVGDGNVLVRWANWNGGRGAVTWVDGKLGLTGTVSNSNSFVGETIGDRVGSGVSLLGSDRYLLLDSAWNGGRGAVTIAPSNAPFTGVHTTTNSLMGTNPSDRVGLFATSLANGNVIIRSPSWNANRGAVTFVLSSTAVLAGQINSANSLVGDDPNDLIGVSVNEIGQNYAVISGGNLAAVTIGSSASGVAGVKSLANSFVASDLADGQFVFADQISGTQALARLPGWNGGRGAIAFFDAVPGVTGSVSTNNSIVGSLPGDRVGEGLRIVGGVPVSYSGRWGGGRGAATPIEPTAVLTGVVGSANSILGATQVNTSTMNVIADTRNGTFLASFENDGPGKVIVGMTGPGQVTYGRAAERSLAVLPEAVGRSVGAGQHVTMQASNDVTIASALTITGTRPGSLTLATGRSVLVTAPITTGGRNLTLVANDDLSAGVIDTQRDPGPATINQTAPIDVGMGTLTFIVKAGAGKTNRQSAPLTLGPIVAASVVVSGPAAVIALGPTPFTTPPGLNLQGGATLTGTGAVNGSLVFGSGGVLSPGASPGTIDVSGDLTLGPGSTFVVEAPSAQQNDQLAVNGALTLGGTLSLSLGFVPPLSQRITLVTKTSAGPSNGTFNGLAEGAVISRTVGSSTVFLRISYRGGDGNDIVLTAVPAPPPSGVRIVAPLAPRGVALD
ncbi:MAG: hypothetical protein U0556_11200 [Dehalococcoidia bacterium]